MDNPTDLPKDNRPTRLELENFMAFERAQFDFGRDLNVFVGENGTGKTQVLKLLYATKKVLFDSTGPGPLNPRHVEAFLVRKLQGLFRHGDSPATLIRDGAARSTVLVNRGGPMRELKWRIDRVPPDLLVQLCPFSPDTHQPVYIPPVDLLGFYPGFVSTYHARHVEFDETWFDASMLLGQATMKQLEPEVGTTLGLLESLVDGKVELDPAGRFYLALRSGERREMPLVAEGLRKLGVVARLVAVGALGKDTSVFWDEPETSLNPKLIKEVAKVIVALARCGIQVFIATHDLFLLRELDMLLATGPALDTRFFGLHLEGGAVVVSQGPTSDDIGPIAALDETLAQSDRYLELSDAEVL